MGDTKNSHGATFLGKKTLLIAKETEWQDFRSSWRVNFTGLWFEANMVTGEELWEMWR